MTPDEEAAPPAGADQGAPEAAVRAEAGRLVRRLDTARDRLAAALPAPPHPAPPHSRAVPASARGATRANAPSARERGGEALGGEAGARIEGADDEVRTLLGPAVERLGRLAELTRALAEGSLSEEDASAAVRALADSQPTRRPR